jgi:hypothetical protein
VLIETRCDGNLSKTWAIIEEMLYCVETYSATVEMPSTTVPSSVLYSIVDGSSSLLCNVDGIDDSGWTTIIKRAKTGRPGRLPRMQGHLERPREASMCEK